MPSLNFTQQSQEWTSKPAVKINHTTLHCQPTSITLQFKTPGRPLPSGTDLKYVFHINNNNTIKPKPKQQP